jgi:diguanylate cyclase (GGDEF)-like protein
MAEVLPQDTFNPDALINTHRHSSQMRSQMEVCAQELAMANRTMKEKLAGRATLEGAHELLLWSESIENKLKQFANDLRLLDTALAQEIVQRQDLQEKLTRSAAQSEKHRYLAFHDSLTGLANRALFHDRLDLALRQYQRHQRSFAVMLIDLNQFKSVNDTFGHDVGDQVLRLVAQQLRACVRQEDTVGRSGGDEFVCLLLEVKEDDAIANVAASMLALIAQVSGLVEITTMLRASLGTAICPRDGNTAEALLNHADAAMYQAKRAGKGHCLRSGQVAAVAGVGNEAGQGQAVSPPEVVGGQANNNPY